MLLPLRSLLCTIALTCVCADLQYNGPVSKLDSEEAVIKAAASSSGVAIVEFYAPWCPHCQHFAPTYGSLATQYEDAPSVTFFAVNCEDHADVCTANEVKGFPTIKAFVKNTNSTYKGDQTLGNLTAWITESLAEHGLPAPKIKEAPAPAWQHENKTRISPSPVRRMDLAATLFNGFEQMIGQIPDGGHMSVTKTGALLTWLHRVSTIPGLAVPLQQMVKSTADGLSLTGRSTATGISKASLSSALDDLQLWGFAYGKKGSYPTLRGNEKEWSACAGPGHGYPCGLWQLLHSLTVYSDGGPASSGIALASAYPAATDEEMTDAQKVLVDIRLFIEQFFPCEQCRSHFLQEVGAPDGEVVRSISSRGDVLLWLWRTHNKVSKRLAPEWGISEELVVYPPVRSCEKCRQTSLSSPQGWKWSETQVMGFLDNTFKLEAASMVKVSSPGKGITLKSLLGGGRKLLQLQLQLKNPEFGRREGAIDILTEG